MGVYRIYYYMEDTVCPYTMGYAHNTYYALVLYTMYVTPTVHVLLYSVCILPIRDVVHTYYTIYVYYHVGAYNGYIQYLKDAIPLYPWMGIYPVPCRCRG